MEKLFPSAASLRSLLGVPAFVGALLAFTAPSLGCRGPKPTTMIVDVAYVDTGWNGKGASPVQGSLQVEVEDARAGNPLVVGVSEEDSPPTALRAQSKTAVPLLVADAVAAALRASGRTVVRSGGAHRLRVILHRATVHEGNLYEGSIVATFEVFAGDKRIFSQRFTGASKRWGRSLSAENVNEALSEAVLNTCELYLRADAASR